MKLQLLAIASAVTFSHIVVARLDHNASELDAAASSSEPTMLAQGKYIWDLIFDHNSNSGAKIEHNQKFNQSGSYTSDLFYKAISEEAGKHAQGSSLNFGPGVSYRVVSARLAKARANNNEVDSMLQRATMIQPGITESYSRTLNRNYTIVPNRKLLLYQRIFVYPGIKVRMEALKETQKPLQKGELEEKVYIRLVLGPKRWIKNLEVVYSDNVSAKPFDRVRDWFGSIDNVNFPYGEKIVSLVPVWTTKVSEAATGFDFIKTPKDMAQYRSICVGTPGDNRYLVPRRDSNQDLFISAVTLFRYPRLSHRVNYEEAFWTNVPVGNTGDISDGIGGSDLRLVWQKQKAYML